MLYTFYVVLSMYIVFTLFLNNILIYANFVSCPEPALERRGINRTNKQNSRGGGDMNQPL